MSRFHSLRRLASQLHRAGTVRWRVAALAVLLSALPAWAAEEAPVASPSAHLLEAGCRAPDSEVVLDADRGISVERVQGEAARTHLLNLMASHPEPFASARSTLAERGANPTEQVFVLRSLALADPVPALSKAPGSSPDSVAIGDGSGEMIFWSWDDGDPSTWEGQIYVANYEHDFEAILETQFAIGSVPYSVVWGSTIWSRRGPYQQFPDATSTGGDATFGAESLVSLLASGGPGVLAGGDEPPRPEPRAQHYLNCWLEGVGGGCATAAVACLVSGPVWIVCFLEGCLAWTPLVTTVLCLHHILW